jgi:DNA mismatch repair ATPase MutS
MKEEIIQFVRENSLRPFEKTSVRVNNNSIFRTKDAKDVHTKVLNLISDNFIFSDSSSILKFFEGRNSPEQIEQKQEFFQTIALFDNSVLKKIQRPKPIWKPKYEIVVVTEDESTILKLQKIGCPYLFINTESDLDGLERYDLVQVVNCENFSRALERLPQTVFVNRIEDVYLERFLVQLSGWKNNIDVLNIVQLSKELTEIKNELNSLLFLIGNETSKKISEREIIEELERINEIVLNEIKKMTLSGESVLSMLQKGIPKEIKEIIEKQLSSSNVPSHIFDVAIPLKIDEKAKDDFLKNQANKEFANSNSLVMKNSLKIKKIPELLKNLEEELIYFDFISGIKKFSSTFGGIPVFSENFRIDNSKNIFLKNAQPINFNLTNEKRCSILTGANSGGKTTLIEHIIQLVSLSQLGLNVSGELSVPLFSDVYYFAKNKGSMSKGAFETLLTQMSEIKPGEKTLILADEIEAVTEPGVAGQIIVATAEYFLDKNCFLVIATHLGQEIKDILPSRCRIDGIEAKGLTENYELIVDHNPVLGRLANSTPELIVEKMAKSLKKDYFVKLYEFLKK